MAVVYGEIDSLESLITALNNNGVDFLSSLEEIKSFNKQFEGKMIEIENNVKARLNAEIEELRINLPVLESDLKDKIEKKEKELLKEKDKLSKEIKKFSKKPKRFYSKILFIIKKYFLQKRKNNLTKNIHLEKKKPFVILEESLNSKNNNLKYLENNLKNEISKRLASEASFILKAKRVLDDNKQLFFGAIGEHKAADELKQLPDDYILINNFHLKMNTPIFNRSTNQRIYSIQADHIVIGPSGIFLIETKNWSKESIENLDLYSPVEQVKRSSFALFCILNDAVKSGELSVFNDHWGDRKISVRNIILMVNAKPKKEFQYVKVLGLSEICRYIKYFEPIFNNKEVKALKDYLI